MTTGPADPYRDPDPTPPAATPPASSPRPAAPVPPTSGVPEAAYPYPGAYPAAYLAYDPVTGQPFSDKSKIVAGVLQIALGAFGAGRFYTGHIGIAIAQIAVTWLTCGIGSIWPLIDGIIILVQGGTDAQGRVLRPS